MERLIVCQGTAQLVTAVAALRRHAADGMLRGRTQPSRDHLLICGLAVSETQGDAFARMIEQMAPLLHPFASIRRLSDASLRSLLAASAKAAGIAQVTTLLREATGIDGADEVFAVRDWQPCNVLAFGAFPEALHVCYGDSVGVYLPRDFMGGRPTGLPRVAALLRRWRDRRSPLPTHPRVDLSYLLLPDAFGRPPGNRVVRTESSTLRDLFGGLKPLLDPVSLANLRDRTAGRPLWVLMGSNFSEQGLMSPEAEMAAYREWVASLEPEPGTVLLIKSHPRDRTGKREMLERHLEGLFGDILSADSAGSSYLPVETLLLDLLPTVGSLQSLTVSTACLATHFVVGSMTHIGFGDALVAKYVAPARRDERRRHESDLRRLCAA